MYTSSSQRRVVAEKIGTNQHDINQNLTRLLLSPNLHFSARLKQGTQVLLKPYLNALNANTLHDTRLTNPAIIEALLTLLTDRGCDVTIGSLPSHCSRETDQSYHHAIHALARRFNVRTVDFNASPSQFVKGALLFPRGYHISKAVLDADVIINCANLQMQPRLIISGAVRNMLNAVVGSNQSFLYQCFPSHKNLAKRVADVCKICKPSINLLDISRGTANSGSVNQDDTDSLILASSDPVALDTVAAHALDESRTVWTNYFGKRLKLGENDLSNIDLYSTDGKPITLPSLSAASTPQTAKESTPPVMSALNYFYQSLTRQKPVIKSNNCNQCGECVPACPQEAIALNDSGKPFIKYDDCSNCRVCVSSCDQHAIQIGHGSNKSFFHQSWDSAKSGVRIPLGFVDMNLNLRKRAKRRLPVLRKVQRKEARFEHVETYNQPADEARTESALIVGAGVGLGSAIARECASHHMNVATVARDVNRMQSLIEELRQKNVKAQSYYCDATYEKSVKEMMASVVGDHGIPDLVVYNVEHFSPGGILDISTSAFEDCWRANCLGAFIIAREVARKMLERGSGTIIFTGATAATRGKAGYINMTVGKAGARMLAQSLARELGPKGIHVAHLVLDSGIFSKKFGVDVREKQSKLFPEEIAKTIYHLHKQHKSTWTHEMDLRPWCENF